MKVKINENWRIENNDSLNYVLYERVKIDQSNPRAKNTHRDVVRGYYGSLKACLKGYVHRATDSVVIKGDVRQLIDMIENIEEEIERVLK